MRSPRIFEDYTQNFGPAGDDTIKGLGMCGLVAAGAGIEQGRFIGGLIVATCSAGAIYFSEWAGSNRQRISNAETNEADSQITQ